MNHTDENVGLEIELYLQRSVLEPREKIVWKGRPTPIESIQTGWFEAMFGLFFFGFAVFWTVGASVAGGLFGLFGIPFMVVGGWKLTKPLRTWLRARKTYYAVTNRRILIITRSNGYQVASIYAHEFNRFARKDKGDGAGSIRFRKSFMRTRRGSQEMTSFADGLWGVADVRGADRAISKLRDQLAGHA